MELFHAFCSVFRAEHRREPQYEEEEEEEILGSDDDEQEDPEDYQKGTLCLRHCMCIDRYKYHKKSTLYLYVQVVSESWLFAWLLV